jgi:hypothetical protein
MIEPTTFKYVTVNTNMIRVLREYIKANLSDSDITTITIDRTNELEFRGNFFGLLNYLKIPTEFWYITMELNNIDNPFLYDGLLTDVKTYNPTILGNLVDVMNDYKKREKI